MVLVQLTLRSRRVYFFVYNNKTLSCQDKHQSSRLCEVKTLQMMKEIHKMVLDYRQLKIRELAEIVSHIYCKFRQKKAVRKLVALFARNGTKAAT